MQWEDELRLKEKALKIETEDADKSKEHLKKEQFKTKELETKLQTLVADKEHKLIQKEQEIALKMENLNGMSLQVEREKKDLEIQIRQFDNLKDKEN